MGGLAIAGVLLIITILCSAIVGLVCLYKRRDKLKTEWARITPKSRNQSQEQLIQRVPNFNSITIELSPEGCTGPSQHFITQDRKTEHTDKMFNGGSRSKYYKLAKHDEYVSPSEMYLHRLLQAGSNVSKYPRRSARDPYSERSCYRSSISLTSPYHNEDLHMALLDERRRAYRQSSSNELCYNDNEEPPLRNGYRTYGNTHRMWEPETGKSQSSSNIDLRQLSDIRRYGERHVARIRRVHFNHKHTRSCPEERDMSPGKLRGILRSTSLINQRGTYDGQYNIDTIRQSRSVTDHKHMTDIEVDINPSPISPITTDVSLKEVKDAKCGEDSKNTSVKDIIAGLNESIKSKTPRSPSPKKSVKHASADTTDNEKVRHCSNAAIKHNKMFVRQKETRKKDSACQTSFDEGSNDENTSTDFNSPLKQMQTQTDDTIGETNASSRDTRKSTSSTSLKSVKDIVGGLNERQNKRTGTKIASLNKSGKTNNGYVRTHSMIPTLNRSPTTVASTKEAAGEDCNSPREPKNCHPKPQHTSLEEVLGKYKSKSTNSITPKSPFLQEKVESYDSEINNSPIETNVCVLLPQTKANIIDEKINKPTKRTPPPILPRKKKSGLAKPGTNEQIMREPNTATRQMSVKEIIAGLNCSLHDESRNNSSPSKELPMEHVNGKISATCKDSKDTNSIAEMSYIFTDEARSNVSPTKGFVEKNIGDKRMNSEVVEETNSTKPTKTVKEIVDEIKKESRGGKDSDLIIRQFSVNEVSDDSNDDPNEIERFGSQFLQSSTKQIAVDINVNHSLSKDTTHSTPVRDQSIGELVINFDRHSQEAQRDASQTKLQATRHFELLDQNLFPDSEKYKLANSEEHVMRNVNTSSRNIDRDFEHFIKSDETIVNNTEFTEVGEYRRKSKDYLPSSKSFGTKYVPPMPMLSDSCSVDFQTNESQEVLHSADVAKGKHDNKTEENPKHIQQCYNSADMTHQTDSSQKDTTMIERHSPIKKVYKMPVSNTLVGFNLESTKLHNEDLNDIHLSHAPLSSVPNNPNKTTFSSKTTISLTTDSPSGNGTTMKTDPLVTVGTVTKRSPKPTPPKVAPRPFNRRGFSCKRNEHVSPSFQTELIQPISPTTTYTSPKGTTEESHLTPLPSEVYSTRSPEDTKIRDTIQYSDANLRQSCQSLVTALKDDNNDSPIYRNCDVSHENQDTTIRKPGRRVSFGSPIASILNYDFVTSDSDTEDEESDGAGVSELESHTPTTLGNSCSDDFVLKCALPAKVPLKTCSAPLQLCSSDTGTTTSVLQSDENVLSGHKKIITDVSPVSKVYTNTRWSMRTFNTMPSITKSCMDEKDTEKEVSGSTSEILPDPPPCPSEHMTGSLNCDIISKDDQAHSNAISETYKTCNECHEQGNETHKDALDCSGDFNGNDKGMVTVDSSDGRFEEMDLGTKRNYGRRISLDTVIADIVTRRRAERRQTKTNDTINGDEN